MRDDAAALRLTSQAGKDSLRLVVARSRENAARSSSVLKHHLNQLYRDRKHLKLSLALRLADDVRLVFTSQLVDVEKRIAELEAKLARLHVLVYVSRYEAQSVTRRAEAERLPIGVRNLR